MAPEREDFPIPIALPPPHMVGSDVTLVWNHSAFWKGVIILADFNTRRLVESLMGSDKLLKKGTGPVVQRKVIRPLPRLSGVSEVPLGNMRGSSSSFGGKDGTG